MMIADEMIEYAANVRFWPKADIRSCTAHVRFRGQSGHGFLRCECPLMTQSGHPLKAWFNPLVLAAPSLESG
jgi:hypothetical protein